MRNAAQIAPEKVARAASAVRPMDVLRALDPREVRIWLDRKVDTRNEYGWARRATLHRRRERLDYAIRDAVAKLVMEQFAGQMDRAAYLALIEAAEVRAAAILDEVGRLLDRALLPAPPVTNNPIRLAGWLKRAGMRYGSRYLARWIAHHLIDWSAPRPEMIPETAEEMEAQLQSLVPDADVDLVDDEGRMPEERFDAYYESLDAVRETLDARAAVRRIGAR